MSESEDLQAVRIIGWPLHKTIEIGQFFCFFEASKAAANAGITLDSTDFMTEPQQKFATDRERTFRNSASATNEIQYSTKMIR